MWMVSMELMPSTKPMRITSNATFTFKTRTLKILTEDMQQIQIMFKPLKILSKLFKSEEMPEAQPYVFEYDRAVPGFNEFTQNLIQQRYDTKRHPSLNEFDSKATKRSRRIKSRD